MAEEFKEYVAIVEAALAQSQPLSQRAHVLRTMLSLAERAIKIEEGTKGGPALRLVAIMLEVRDIAREEQRWVDALLRDEVPAQSVLDVLHFYKGHLAQIEAAAIVAMPFVDSDREDSEDGRWWPYRMGALVGITLGLAPSLLVLPAERAVTVKIGPLPKGLTREIVDQALVGIAGGFAEALPANLQDITGKAWRVTERVTKWGPVVAEETGARLVHEIELDIAPHETTR